MPPFAVTAFRSRPSLRVGCGLLVLCIAACGESTRPPALEGEYAMISYGGEALPAETGRRVRTDPVSGSSSVCVDTVRSAAVVLQQRGAARWRWVGETSCSDGVGETIVAIDNQVAYTVNSRGVVVLVLYPLVVGPAIPEAPPEPYTMELEREDGDLLVLEAPSIEEGPLGGPTQPEDGLFRIVWRRVD